MRVDALLPRDDRAPSRVARHGLAHVIRVLLAAVVAHDRAVHAVAKLGGKEETTTGSGRSSPRWNSPPYWVHHIARGHGLLA